MIDHSSILQAELMLPTQFFDRLRGQPQQGERRLLIAVLEEAVTCFQNYLFASDGRNRGLFREAEQWLLEDGSEEATTPQQQDWYLSCQYICDVIGIDVAYLRRGLRGWRQRQIAAARLRRPALVQRDAA